MLKRAGLKFGVMSRNSVAKLILCAMVLGWLYILILAHMPSLMQSKSLSLRGSTALSGSVHHDVLSTLADARARGEDIHALNMKHEESAVGGRVKPFNQMLDSDYHTEHLVVVAGHAVVRMNQLSSADKQDSAWWLLNYQKGQDFPAIISAHIKRGLELLAMDPSALLVFSGGQTRRDVGPTSEAASYYYVADTQGWIPKLSDSKDILIETIDNMTHREPRERIFLEEYARDSFENLIFSLCRYREVVGVYPRRVTVVGFDFKAERFNRLHRAAIGFPETFFHYDGLHPGGGFRNDVASAGEQGVIRIFESDPYACSKPLTDKVELRNPFHRSIPYPEACPEIRELLTWCGPDIYPDLATLPWTK